MTHKFVIVKHLIGAQDQERFERGESSVQLATEDEPQLCVTDEIAPLVSAPQVPPMIATHCGAWTGVVAKPMPINGASKAWWLR